MANETYFPNGISTDNPGDSSAATGGFVRTGVQKIINLSVGKAVASSGWILGGGATDVVTLAASKSAKTLTCPINGLNVGDKVTAVAVCGQIESAGGTVTIDMTVRKMTTVAGDNTDASLGGITQVSKTADYKVEDSVTLGTAETIALGESLYV